MDDRYSVNEQGQVFSDGHLMSVIAGHYVNLSEGHSRFRRTDIAYLVARQFLPNPEGRPYVCHKDGDPCNNRVENLFWSEKKEELRGRPRGSGGGRSVLQSDLAGNVIKVYKNVTEASVGSGVARSLIGRCLRGEATRAKNWIFRYV